MWDKLRKRVALSYLVQLSSVRFWVKAPEAADSQLFFLSSRAGRGNTCSVAAGFKEGKDDNGSLTVCLQNMGKESKVRISDINTRQKHLDLKIYIFNNICTLFWPQRGFLLLFFSCLSSLFCGFKRSFCVKQAKLHSQLGYREQWWAVHHVVNV